MSVSGSEHVSDLFTECSTKIDDLYAFRDKYFLTDRTRTHADRLEDLTERLTALVTELDNIKDQLESKASYLTLLGKAHNVMPDFNQTACDSLKKATKLDPKSIEAWNYLGECYWKKRDFEMCRICFEQSLSIARNKQGLRGMSMVTRQLIDVPEGGKQQAQQVASVSKYDHIRNSLEDSIKYAKESLQLDVKDGMSWYILANCYVSKFFSPFGQQNPTLLKQAVSAYNLALKDKQVASLQSDLYFNKSMISMYEENWSDALWCLSEALKLDPYWTEANNNMKGTLDYLTQLNEMIAQKGKLKEKKFQALIDSIKRTDLGPYLEYTLQTGSERPPEKNELVETCLKDLQKGLNKNRVLIARVVCGLPTKHADNIVCFSAVLADSNGDCAALTIYNLASGQGVIIGNSVCIPEPWLEIQEFEFESGDKKRRRFDFKSVRVENPLVLVVNGRKWTKDKVSSAFFVPKVMSD